MGLIVVLFFCLIHLFAESTNKFGYNFRSKLLSTGSGIAIAYVFIDILPKLSASDVLVKKSLSFLPYLEKHVYITALIGFLLFFFLDRFQKSLSNNKDNFKKNMISRKSLFFLLSLLSYGIFNFLVGYSVMDKDNPEIQPLLLFTCAIGLHYFTNDYSLTQAHGNLYQRWGRWILSASLLLGWSIGLIIELPPPAVAILSAFIGGGVIMNVIRHELPEEALNNLWAFLFAAIAYTVVLLAIGRV